MKEYANEEITVIWDPNKCIHARECTKGLPQVFNREKRPWIDIDGASSEEIMSIIDRCPSGALTYKKDGPRAKAQNDTTQIKVLKNGPLLIQGGCSLLDQESRPITSADTFALCRCGRSKKKPFCDGTHIEIGFDDAK